MSERVDLRGLSVLLQRYMAEIRKTAKSVADVQNLFTEAYGERERRYQETIGALVDAIVAAGAGVGDELHAPIRARLVEERELLAARRRELREALLPRAQEDADGFLALSQEARAAHQATNRRLREQEVELQAEIERLEAELEALNAAIKEQGRFLGVLLHFGSLLKLSKRRREVLQALTETQAQLRDTRQRWQQARTTFEEEQAQLREELQAALLQRSQLQTELDYLDDDEQRALLAHQRAVRHVLDALREPVELADPALEERVNALAVLNAERERYLAGLQKAAHVLGLLSGIAKGVRAFQESVQKLIQQQQQYSQHLRPLQVTVPDAVQDFFAHFRRLDERISKAARFREEPEAFTAHARAFIESAGDRQIQQVFETLGGALNQAAETQWR